MAIQCRYRTPAGFSDMVMTSDGTALTGLHFVGGRNIPSGSSFCAEPDLPVFRETRRWLDVYFGGRQPSFTPPCRILDLTPFRQEVLNEMRNIPFGETVTYGEIATVLARRHDRAKMSAQAVGGAVGWNPLCLIIPCHRVVGARGALTGYGGGMANKISLLALEGHAWVHCAASARSSRAC